jgi:hypothetical protein
MSIDDRLRAGLIANADVTGVAVERNLETVWHRNRRRVQLRVAVAVAAAALLGVVPWAVVAALDERGAGPASPETPQVVGSYRVQVRAQGETRTMTGTWTVTFEAGGGLTLDPPDTFDGVVGEGEGYTLDGDRLTTNAFLGWPGCQRTAPPVGAYQVDPDPAEMRFELISDSCGPRIELFGARWERLP